MIDKKYSIIYSSKTGNTQKLAETIQNILPKDICQYYGTVEKAPKNLSNLLYIGFWT